MRRIRMERIIEASRLNQKQKLEEIRRSIKQEANSDAQVDRKSAVDPELKKRVFDKLGIK